MQKKKLFVNSFRSPPLLRRACEFGACAALLLLVATLSLPALADDAGEKMMDKGSAKGESVVPLVAKTLMGRWQLDARVVTTGKRQEAATAQQLTVYDIREVSDTKATGKVIILESGILDTFVENPALFEEDPHLVGAPYSLGGLWDVTFTEVPDTRCTDGTGARMKFEGESEGSFGIFKYGCVTGDLTEIVFCKTEAGFEMVGVARTDTGVEGVADVWTAFSVETDGNRPRLMHELPREASKAGGEARILKDFYTKLDSDTKVRRQSVEGIWKELIENKTLINGNLNVGRLLATL